MGRNDLGVLLEDYKNNVFQVIILTLVDRFYHTVGIIKGI